MVAARLTGLALCACLLAIAAPLRADLGSDVAELKTIWGLTGRVVQQKPRLLERGSVLPILVPLSMLDVRRDGCLTVAVLGTTTSHFVLHLGSRGPGDVDTPPPQASVAGVVEITRCGLNRLDLMRMAVEMRSPRAVLETLIAESDRPLAAVPRILTHRDAGPLAELGGPGPRPTPAPLEHRLTMLESRLRREGAMAVTRQALRTRADGTAETSVVLREGCHELHLLSDDGAATEGLLLDLELAADSGDADEPLSFEPSETADAAQKLCLGASTRARLYLGGAAPNATVSLVSAHFELPRGLPERWGPLARARVASTFRRYALPSPEVTPFYESLGVQGVTRLPVEVTPGTCYVAALTSIRGEFGAMALAVESGANVAQNHVLSPNAGTAVAFCARDNTRANVEIESKGFGLAWLMSIWEAGTLPPGEVQP